MLERLSDWRKEVEEYRALDGEEAVGLELSVDEDALRMLVFDGIATYLEAHEKELADWLEDKEPVEIPDPGWVDRWARGAAAS